MKFFSITDAVEFSQDEIRVLIGSLYERKQILLSLLKDHSLSPFMRDCVSKELVIVSNLEDSFWKLIPSTPLDD